MSADPKGRTQLLGLAPDVTGPGGLAKGDMSNVDAAAIKASLGYTPIVQGAGEGQLENTVSIGWSGARLKAQVDLTDLGNIATDNTVAAAVAPKAEANLSNVAGGALVPTAAFEGGTSAGFYQNKRMVWSKAGGVGATAFDVFDNKFLRRTLDVTGGTAGWVNTCVSIAQEVGENNASFEWSLTCTSINFGMAGTENCSGYLQIEAGVRSSGPTGATIAGVSELLDNAANPAYSRVSHEFDNTVTGTDVSRQRVITHYVARRKAGATGAAEVGEGIRFECDANTTILTGISFGKAGLTGRFVDGIDMTGGTFSGKAIVLGLGQALSLDATGSLSLRANTEDGFRYQFSYGGDLNAVEIRTDSGAEGLYIQGNRLVSPHGPEAQSFTVGTVPNAAGFVRTTIYVSNEAGGAVLAFSDGTNWRRVTDRAVIS